MSSAAPPSPLHRPLDSTSGRIIPPSSPGGGNTSPAMGSPPPPPSSYSTPSSPLLSRIQRQIASPQALGFPFGGHQSTNLPNQAILAQYQAMMEKLLGNAAMLSPPGSETSAPSPCAPERSAFAALSPSQTLPHHVSSRSPPGLVTPAGGQTISGNLKGRNKL